MSTSTFALTKNTKFDKQTENMFHLISYKRNKPIIVGSAKYKELLFPADYDMFELVVLNQDKHELIKDVHKIFFNMCEKIMSNVNIYFIEFKAGIYKPAYLPNKDILNKTKRMHFYKQLLHSEIISKDVYNHIKKLKSSDELLKYCTDLYKMRWTLKELMQGFIILDNGAHYLFSHIFEDNSIIKLDVMLYDNSTFIAFSNMFEFIYSNKLKINREYINRTIQTLKKDVITYKSKGNYFKSFSETICVVLYRLKSNATPT